jgi:hypothetical protein
VSEADAPCQPVERRSRRLRAGAIALASTAVMTALVACTKSADSSQPVALGAAPSASSSANSEADAAGKAAVDAYDAALTYEVGAFAKMKSTAADLRKYLGEPDLDSVAFATSYFGPRGIVYKGKPSWQATPTNVDLAASPPIVTLSVCFTGNGWQAVYESSGKPYITSKDPAHQLEIASVTRIDGKWLLTQEQVQGQPC